MQSMLEVRRRDHYCINVFECIQFFIVFASNDVVLKLVFQEVNSFIPAYFPDVGNGNNVEIEFFVMLHECGDMRLLVPVGKTNDTNPYAVIGA